MFMVSPVNLSIGIIPSFPAVREYTSDSQTRPKSQMRFGKTPPYSSTLSLVLNYFYRPFGSVLPRIVWLRCPTINAKAMYVFL